GGLPIQTDAFSVVAGSFSQEAAAEVIRQVEDHLRAHMLPSPAQEAGAQEKRTAPTAEYLYVALRWLSEQKQDQMIIEIHTHLEGVNPDNPEESLGPYIAFIKWIVTADANYIKDVTSQKYTIALSEVLTEAVTPSAELIENSLSGGRVSE